MFEKCCDEPRLIEDGLLHSPIPFKYHEDTERILKLLCLYAPCVDSAQARTFSILADSANDEPVFRFMLERLGVDENRDVLILGGNECVPDDLWDFYHGDSACLSCQKLVFRKTNERTKTVSLLRAVRNCLAHGDFYVAEDKLIGFNTYKKQKTAVIRVDFAKLLAAVDELTHFTDVESLSHADFANAILVRAAFARMGYVVRDSVEEAASSSIEGLSRASSDIRLYDFAVRKDEKVFAVYIFSFDGRKYLHSEDIGRVLNFSDSLNAPISGRVMVARSRLTKNASELLAARDDIFVMSREETDRLLMDKDVLMQKLEASKSPSETTCSEN